MIMAKTKQKEKCECDCCSCKFHCMMLCKAVWLTLFGVFLAHYLSDVWGVEKYAINNGTIGWIALFAFYLVFMIVGLKIVWLFHKCHCKK